MELLQGIRLDAGVKISVAMRFKKLDLLLIQYRLYCVYNAASD